ncbi:hypothetical protein N657DRAFT_257925 [Parathielavia appendiculata]|uniref:Uncharacterized protein n=1 Tax=Parathielavia appendiculata TaxID=2587402 RepID=A0AAN6TRK4_9PEZI|nr:hypothetical protein N657DRAFT_257925 [Parathielavia appendiculata]
MEAADDELSDEESVDEKSTNESEVQELISDRKRSVKHVKWQDSKKDRQPKGKNRTMLNRNSKRLVKKAADDELTYEESAEEETTNEQSIIAKPADEQSSDEQSSDEQSSDEQSSDEQSSDEQSSDEQSSDEQSSDGQFTDGPPRQNIRELNKGNPKNPNGHGKRGQGREMKRSGAIFKLIRRKGSENR